MSMVDIVFIDLVNQHNDIVLLARESGVALVAAPDPQVVDVHFDVFEGARELPGRADDEAVVEAGGEPDRVTCWGLERLLASCTAVTLPVILNHHVLVSARQTAILINSWSGKLNAVALGLLVEEVLLDEELSIFHFYGHLIGPRCVPHGGNPALLPIISA